MKFRKLKCSEITLVLTAIALIIWGCNMRIERNTADPPLEDKFYENLIHEALHGAPADIPFPGVGTPEHKLEFVTSAGENATGDVEEAKETAGKTYDDALEEGRKRFNDLLTSGAVVVDENTCSSFMEDAASTAAAECEFTKTSVEAAVAASLANNEPLTDEMSTIINAENCKPVLEDALVKAKEEADDQIAIQTTAAKDLASTSITQIEEDSKLWNLLTKEYTPKTTNDDTGETVPGTLVYDSNDKDTRKMNLSTWKMVVWVVIILAVIFGLIQTFRTSKRNVTKLHQKVMQGIGGYKERPSNKFRNRVKRGYEKFRE